MEPLYTLLLCLPAVLGVIVCACGLAALGLTTARPAAPPQGSRRHGGGARRLRPQGGPRRLSALDGGKRGSGGKPWAGSVANYQKQES